MASEGEIVNEVTSQSSISNLAQEQTNSSAQLSSELPSHTENASKETNTEVKRDRVVTEVIPPPLYPLSLEALKDSRGMPRLDVLKEHLSREGRLSTEASDFLIQGAAAALRNEPNLLILEYPLTGILF